MHPKRYPIHSIDLDYTIFLSGFEITNPFVNDRQTHRPDFSSAGDIWNKKIIVLSCSPFFCCIKLLFIALPFANRQSEKRFVLFSFETAQFFFCRFALTFTINLCSAQEENGYFSANNIG